MKQYIHFTYKVYMGLFNTKKVHLKIEHLKDAVPVLSGLRRWKVVWCHCSCTARIRSLKQNMRNLTCLVLPSSLVSLYLKTASRLKGYGPVLGCLRTGTGKVTLLHSPESKSWPGRETEGRPGPTGSLRTDWWRGRSPADGVNKETSGTGRKRWMLFFNRV